MKNKQHQGPTTYIAPSEPIEICNGCKFLNTLPALTFNVLNHHACRHSNYVKEYPTEIFTGRLIHINHKDLCETPDWCPLIKTQK